MERPNQRKEINEILPTTSTKKVLIQNENKNESGSCDTKKKRIIIVTKIGKAKLNVISINNV